LLSSSLPTSFLISECYKDRKTRSKSQKHLFLNTAVHYHSFGDTLGQVFVTISSDIVDAMAVNPFIKKEVWIIIL
jgi:hypothetical protein